MVADAEREVVGRAFHRPVPEERADVRRELAVGVGVAGGRDGACERLAFSDDELERAVGLEPEGHHRDRPFLDVELDARTASRLAVVLLERAKDGLLRGDVEMVGTVVPDEHRVAVEVDRMEFREAAADVEAVEDHHRDAVLEVELAAHREAGRGEKRVADDEVGDELARRRAGLALVVVGKAVEVALLDELLERARGLCRDVEILGRQLLGPRVGNGIGGVEEVEDALFHRLDVRRDRLAVERHDLVGLAEGDMAAERARNGSRVDLHVVHRLENVAHEPDPGAAQVVEDVRDGAPLANLLFGLGVAVELSDYNVRDRTPIAYGDACELGNGAEVVVQELLVDRRVLVVEARVGLERDEDDRALQLAHERREGGARRVSHHVDEEEVEVGRLHRRNERRGLLGIVGDAKRSDIDIVRLDALLEDVRLLEHVIVETGALLPVGV